MLCSAAGRTGWVCIAVIVLQFSPPSSALPSPPLQPAQLRAAFWPLLGVRCYRSSLQRAAARPRSGVCRYILCVGGGVLCPLSPPGCAQALVAHRCRVFTRPGVVRSELLVPQGRCCSSGVFQQCRHDLSLAATPMESRGQRRRVGTVFSATEFAGTAWGSRCERRRRRPCARLRVAEADGRRPASSAPI